MNNLITAVTSDESGQMFVIHAIFRMGTTVVKESVLWPSLHYCVPKNKMNSKVAVFSDVTPLNCVRGLLAFRMNLLHSCSEWWIGDYARTLEEVMVSYYKFLFHRIRKLNDSPLLRRDSFLRSGELWTDY